MAKIEKYPAEYMENLGICGEKRCYDKRGAITAKNKRYRDSHIKLRVYECPECGYWHLTKKL